MTIPKEQSALETLLKRLDAFAQDFNDYSEKYPTDWQPLLAVRHDAIARLREVRNKLKHMLNFRKLGKDVKFMVLQQDGTMKQAERTDVMKSVMKLEEITDEETNAPREG